MIIDLQMFNDAEPEVVEPEVTEPEATEPEAPEPEKTFTQEQINEIVSKRLERERKKFEEDFRQKLDHEKKEAERLARLSESEKQKEIEKKRQQQLEEKESSLKRRELLLDTADILSDRGLPKNFAEILAADNAENTMQRIDSFQEAFQAEIEKAVSERLKSGYKPNKGSEAVTFTKEQIKNMSPEEINANYEQISQLLAQGQIK